MKINTKVKLEHSQCQIYICCPPRIPSKILRVQRLLWVEKALKKKMFRKATTLLTMTLNITYHAIWHWTIKQLTLSMFAKILKIETECGVSQSSHGSLNPSIICSQHTYGIGVQRQKCINVGAKLIRNKVQCFTVVVTLISLNFRFLHWIAL